MTCYSAAIGRGHAVSQSICPSEVCTRVGSGSGPSMGRVGWGRVGSKNSPHGFVGLGRVDCRKYLIIWNLYATNLSTMPIIPDDKKL